MSWNRLCRTEPQLRALEREASTLSWSEICGRLRRLVEPCDYDSAVEHLAKIWASGAGKPAYRRGRSTRAF